MPSSSSRGKRKESPVGARGVSPPPAKRRVQSTTTQNAVTNFFKPSSDKEPEKTAWTTIDSSLLVARYQSSEKVDHASKRRKIAAFDLDGTLIRTTSGKKFSSDSQDWTWWNAVVPGHLQNLDRDGYLIIVFSNQGGLQLATKAKQDSKRVSEFKVKVNALLSHFNCPIALYAATEKDQYRKPRTGMWRQMLNDLDLNGDQGIELEECFFVGDAAGRIRDEQGDPNDFASSDRDFAANVGIQFHTPEEYFLGQKAKAFRTTFDFTPYITVSEPRMSFKKLHEKDVVMFCGSPGAGKSTFYKVQLAPLGYERINQDILKTRDKCLKVADEFIKQDRSVAVDNTNATVETRSVWVALAKTLHVPIRCVLFSASPLLCQHNEAVRSQNVTMNPESRTPLPKIAFTSFASHYQPPRLEEGFEDITVVDFKFQGTEEERALWAQHYL